MEYYRQFIKEMVDKITDWKALKRIYALAEYLYIKENEENN